MRIPKKQGYISGILTNAALNSDGITIRVQENKLEDEDLENPTGLKSYVKLTGDWVKYIQSDIESTLRLKIYLETYDPIFNEQLWRWEFRAGIRVDCIILEGEDRLIIKRLDVSSRPLRSSSAGLLAATKLFESFNSPEKSDYNPALTSADKDLSNKSITSNGSRRSPTRSEKNSKRPRLSGGNDPPPGNHDQPNSDLPRQSTSRAVHSPERNNRNGEDSESEDVENYLVQGEQRTIQSPENSNAFQDQNSPPESAIVNAPRGPSLAPQPIKAGPSNPLSKWKTLKEIDSMSGGNGQYIDFMGIISQTKTSECEKSGLGTCDYKMTLYLTDNSRSLESRDVTCNLFWKSESSCPPWSSSPWKVIFLWSVYKRYSNEFNTQLVGRSDQFKWALWCPPYRSNRSSTSLSSNEKMVFDPTIDSNWCLRKSGEDLEGLKVRAQALYQNHLSNDLKIAEDLGEPNTPSNLGLNQSILRISDLRNRPYGTVDLCVQIVDLWLGAPDSDRLTVTDFTMNPLPIKRYSPTSQVTQLHHNNGGNLHNLSITSNRMFSIYVSQPILSSAFKRILSDQQERGRQKNDENYESFGGGGCRGGGSYQMVESFNDLSNVHRLRETFSGRYFKLCQVSLRRRNDGSLYGSMEKGSSSSNINKNGNSHGQDGEDGNFSVESDLTNRILTLDESNEYVIRSMEAFDRYQQELLS